MEALNAVTLLVNGLTLALALGFLLIVLWNDAGKELNQFFAAFLLLVMIWNAGALVLQAVLLLDSASPLLTPILGLMELGFTGAGIVIYILTAVLVKAHTRRFRALAFAALTSVLVMRLLLILSSAPLPFEAPPTGALVFRPQAFQTAFYLVFNGGTLLLLWRYHRKIRSRGLIAGIGMFVLGQSLGFLNPALQAFSISVSVSAVAALIISFALLRQEIIRPLAERNSQVEAIRKVSMAITSLTALDTVLEQIALQTAGLLNADAVGIFLKGEGALELATGYGLPASFLGSRIPMGEGMAGTAALSSQSLAVDDYRHDWRGSDDFPLARETFGSVICTPLVYANEAIGALMVIAGRHGRLFVREDGYLLELLGAQAAVAIAHSRLFAEQGELTRQVESARGELETVLVSTESPVIAVDRRFRLLFANPAARALFSAREAVDARPIHALLPKSAFPGDARAALRSLRRTRAYTYEAVLDDRVYLCHLARLGRPRLIGWVAVLNDITQLKELDRLKSEMVRMTSHDLKNPLQAAFANLDMLRDDLSDYPDAEVQQSLTLIDKQLNRMNRIIRGILDLERLRGGALSLELCPPARIIDHALDELAELARESGVTLASEIAPDAPLFPCDVEQFRRAVVNLVENAIKFTPAGGRVCVSARLDNGSLLFAISDTGVGIADELQARVFDRFYRANQKGMEHVSGSGLGLSLVKAVVENHRGRVWLTSKQGIGTTVCIAVPASK
jgi:signal transduction histidine kinase